MITTAARKLDDCSPRNAYWPIETSRNKVIDIMMMLGLVTVKELTNSTHETSLQYLSLSPSFKFLKFTKRKHYEKTWYLVLFERISAS